MKKISKFIILVFIIFISIGTFIYTSTLPIEVETYVVVPKQAQIYFTEQGYVNKNDNLEVFSTLNGEIISVNVSENQSINKGDVICVINSSQYNYDIIKSQNNIKAYEAQQNNVKLEEKKQKDSLKYDKQSLENEYNSLLAQQKSAISQENNLNISKEEKIRLQNIIIEQSKSNLKSAEEDYNKSENLFNIGALSQNEYNKAKENVNLAKTSLESELQQLEIIKSDKVGNSEEYYESTKKSLEAKINGIDNSLQNSYSSAMIDYYSSLINIEKTNIDFLNKQINDCTIKSPVDGKIIKLNINNSNVINTQVPIAVVETNNTNEIEVYISTKNIDDVKINDSVEIISKRQQGDIKTKGKIVKIDDEAVTKISALGIEERKVKIIITPENIENVILNPGFDVDVKFITYDEQNKLTIPKTATFKDSNTDKNLVWVVTDGKADIREIELGFELRTEYIVNSGIFENNILIRDADISGLKKGVNIKDVNN